MSADALKKTAETLAEYCRTQQEDKGLSELYDDGAVSVEMSPMPGTDSAESVGVDAIKGKHEWRENAMEVTGGDVIHSWTIPAFGVKQDGVPGRLAELWFTAEKEGIYFGQCSELCGIAHAYMPITVKVVSEEAYEAWLDAAIEEYAGLPREVKVASN